MKEQIKKIQNYFIEKIVKGEFESTGLDQHYLYITIDGEYNFKLWVCNGSLFLETSGSDNFIALTFTEEQKEALWPSIQKEIEATKDERNKERIAELEKELETLKG